MKSLFYRILRLGLVSLCLDTVMAHEDIAEHLAYLDKAIETAPDRQSLYIQRGTIYSEEAGMHGRALEDFRRAEELGPPIAVAYPLGLLFFRTQDYPKARAYFDQHIARFPGDASPYQYRARAAYRMGEKAQSLADYQAYFRLEERIHPASFIEAAEIQASSGDLQGIDAAIALLDQGMSRLGLNPELQRQAIRLELQRAQPEKAIERLRSMQTLLHESPAWKVEMAELLVTAGKSRQASRYLDEAEAQLAKLKNTPARRDLEQKIRQIKGHPHRS